MTDLEVVATAAERVRDQLIARQAKLKDREVKAHAAIHASIWASFVQELRAIMNEIYPS